MFEAHNDVVYEIIRDAKLLSSDQLREFSESRIGCDESFADGLIESGFATRSAILSLVAEYLNCEYTETLPVSISEEVASSIESSVALRYAVIPERIDGRSIRLLAQDPFNSSIIEDLTFSLNRDVSISVCDPVALGVLLKNTYGEEGSSTDEIFREIGESFEDGREDEVAEDISDLANQGPITRFVNLVLEQAIKDKASDIHFEPFEDEFRIRCRIDGALYEMDPPPKRMAVSVTSRIKVLSNMDISETRIPQDGRIKMTIEGRSVDLRVSTLPTQFGESVVLRVLDKSVVSLDLEALSLPDTILGKIRELVSRPNGIFIVTGPTGSGKTTTLYSALREVNDVETKILTAEDPVEYEIDGITQVAVNHQVGMDFARALRAFLRQDPDKIMIGEIRDLETAQIAVQASLTGHVVLSTLHTNDAPGTVTRLIDLGLEPFLISASLEAVLAQRLVRRICSDCRAKYEPSRELVRLLELEHADSVEGNFYYGKGCAKCGHTGYRGRIGLFEMMNITDEIRELINDRAPTLSLRQKALEQGMRRLRDNGLRTISDGESTIEEILKYT